MRKPKPKKKTYSVYRSVRYHGDLTAYRFQITHKNQEFASSDELPPFFARSALLLIKKAENSPLRRKLNKIKTVTTAVKGVASLDTEEGSHDFPLWQSTQDYFKTPINKIAEFRAQVIETHDGTLKDTQALFIQPNQPIKYHRDASSQATSLKIEESILYVECEPIKKHTKPAPKKKRRRKNRNIRHRNKRMDKGAKNSPIRRKKRKST